MKLAGILARSAGYPLDDPPVMVWSALHQALATCKRYGVEPVGAFEMAMTETWDGSDQALRWEFVPTNDEVPATPHEGDGRERMEG